MLFLSSEVKKRTEIELERFFSSQNRNLYRQLVQKYIALAVHVYAGPLSFLELYHLHGYQYLFPHLITMLN
ncbi:uncharacterized protein PHALS_12114 [Plasmopara halstedii]|uniref:Uncharacterized protein n=1 Tax=Plasmopara halstedii TaxID=4781 RepID=A0A0P1AKX0_PLAHL|nr:uncharacterized protein PHALS_12114 [Plasmopara halstedii]CEG41788.1 hypothetical protein PHALS_12114 [Plasmopara halstedii]|eukprot:XP_024578157.1 hypothetical protein PHALS_12114 [Plasmopara halstedii]